MTLVPFLDRTECNVGQQRRQDSTLRCAGGRPRQLLLGQDAGLQEGDEQPVHLQVGDPPANSIHQGMMVDVVEASFDVPLDGPLVWERSSCFPPFLPGPQEHTQSLERPMDRLPWAKAVRDGKEIRLEDRLQDVLHGCLNDPVPHGGDSQGAKLPRLPWLRDPHSSHRHRPVHAGSQIRARLSDECLNPGLQDTSHRDPVYAGRASAAIARDARKRQPQVPEVRNQPPELAEHVVEMVSTARVQLPLLDLEPGLFGLVRHIRGFP
jgi:hypothetical protein